MTSLSRGVASAAGHARRRVGRSADRRSQALVVAVAIVVGAVAALAVSPRSPLRRGSSSERDTVPPRVVAGRTLLLAHYDARERTDLLALIARQPGGVAASVIFVPPTTVVEVPSLDLVPLADVTRFADRYLLETSMANALGVRIDELLVVDDAGLASLLGPVRSLTVAFPGVVRIEDADGTASWPAGSARLDTASVARVLLGREADGGVAHAVTVQAVFQAWLARLARDPAAARATARLQRSASLLVSVARARVRFDTLPVESADSGGAERYQIRAREAAALVASDFAFARLSVGGRRPRVEILNGVGRAGITPRVARLLVPAGADVRLTSNVPGFGARRTQVVYYRDADAAAARRFVRVLGVGTVAKGATPIEVVDLTVVVGQDFVTARPQ